MKKLIEKIDLKLLTIIIALVIFEAVVFFFTKPFIQNPYILGCSLDKALPFIPAFVWIYVFWYLMLILVPYYIAKKSFSSFLKYACTFIISTLIAGIIFILFPNTVIRADIQGTDISSKLVEIIYLLDNPGINCLPSIHCLFSFLFIYGIFDAKDKVKLEIKLIVTILSLLVVISTLFIKQHVIYDAIAALFVSGIVWLIVDKFKLYSKLKTRDE